MFGVTPKTSCAPRPRKRSYRYRLAALFTAAGLLASALLQEGGTETFAPIVGAVAIVYWYGGVGPGVASLVRSWSIAWFALDPPYGSWGCPDREEFLAWLVPFVVTLIVMWVTWVLRRGGARATERAETAEKERFATQAMHQLTSDLSSAVTPSDVAHALVERLPAILGATGAALGLRDGDDLVIVDPAGAMHQTLEPGLRFHSPRQRRSQRLPARGGDRVRLDPPGSSRRSSRRERVCPYAAGALAVPLRAGAETTGAIGLPFRRSEATDEEVIALARLAADLGGQALLRARLYEQERDAREALDRIARLGAADRDRVAAGGGRALCREAVNTLGADVAQVWATQGETFEVLWREAGERTDLHPARSFRCPTFRADRGDGPTGADVRRRFALERQGRRSRAGEDPGHPVIAPRADRHQGARRAGARAAVDAAARHAVAVDDRAARGWFADQAGLALEHAERRVAQRAASRNAEETRRLLDVTASLAAPLEATAVASAALEQASSAWERRAGTVVRWNGGHGSAGCRRGLSAGGGRRLGTVRGRRRRAHRRRRQERADRGARVSRGAHDAIRRYRRRCLERRVALRAADGRRVDRRGLGLAFGAPRGFDDADREFAIALSRQAGQALARATSLETEHAARMRAERMAAISQSSTRWPARSDAPEAQPRSPRSSSSRSSKASAQRVPDYVRDLERGEASLLDVGGELDPRFSPTRLVGVGRDDSRRHPARTGDLARDGRRLGDGRGCWGLARAGADSVGVVPLVVEDAAIGALFVTFRSPARAGPEDERFVETVARQAAQPFDRMPAARGGAGVTDPRRARRRADPQAAGGDGAPSAAADDGRRAPR